MQKVSTPIGGWREWYVKQDYNKQDSYIIEWILLVMKINEFDLKLKIAVT